MSNASNSEISNLLVQGFKAAKDNRRDEAYNMFCEVVRRDAKNELGWLYRAATTDDLSEAYVCLQRVLDINPANEKAGRGIERIQTRLDNEEGAAEEFVDDDDDGLPPGPANFGDNDSVISGLRSSKIPPPPPPPSLGKMDPAFNFGMNDAPLPRRNPPPMPADLIDTVPTRLPSESRAASNDPMDDWASGSGKPDFDDDDAFDPEAFFGKQTGADDDLNFDPQAPINDDGMVDEPIAEPSRKPRTPPKRTTRPEFGRQATELNQVGQSRAQDARMPFYIAGVVMAVIVFGGLFYFLVLQPKPNPNPNAQLATATDTSGLSGVSTLPIVTNDTSLNPTEGSGGVVVTVVGDISTVPVFNPTAPISVVPATTAPIIAVTVTPRPATARPLTTTAVVAPSTLPRAIVYTIKGGDTASGVSRQYGTTTEAVQAANPGVNISRIFVGNQLVIPVSRPTYRGRGAILKAGETIQTLATRFTVTAEAIIQLNGMSSAADAKVGDAILVP